MFDFNSFLFIFLKKRNFTIWMLESFFHKLISIMWLMQNYNFFFTDYLKMLVPKNSDRPWFLSLCFLRSWISIFYLADKFQRIFFRHAALKIGKILNIWKVLIIRNFAWPRNEYQRKVWAPGPIFGPCWVQLPISSLSANRTSETN